MQRCLADVRFGEALLFTRRDYACPDPRVQVRVVEGVNSRNDYSRFMIRELGSHLSSDHALIVQWDSFIVDTTAWDPAFLDYDYIGAPWPGKTQPVGNGGFSLRSRKLLTALQDSDITEIFPEDQAICEHYHKLLSQRYGIRFAPLEVARRFAFELEAPQERTFGFHGLFNFHRTLSEAELLPWLKQMPAELLRTVQARRLLKNLIRQCNYAAAAEILRVRARGGWQLRLDALKLAGLLATRRIWP